MHRLRCSGDKPCGNTPDIMMFTLSLLTRAVRYFSTRAALAGCSRRTTLHATVLLISFTLLSTTSSSASVKSIDLYKLYAHTKIISASEYRCLDLLWTRESNWNPLSKNKKSSAFGIPQLLKMVTKDPYEQIDLGLKYIKARHSTACLALAYFIKVGHY